MTTKLPRAPAFNYPPVDHCIYCGASTGKLSDEHIIPYGLNGNFVLPRSSCEQCAKITSKIECQVLRGFFENGRRAMGISSRHKKHVKPTSVPVKFISGNARINGEMPIEGGFHVIHLPVFTTPLALGGKINGNSQDGIEIAAIDTLHIGDAEASVRSHRATGIETKTQINTFAFVRMLAKIGYSYYVAEKGVFPRNESPVLSVAMKEASHARQWIGCLEDHPLTKPGSNALHLMDITDITGGDGSVCSVVRIKLFSVCSGPTYSVVTRVHGK